MKHQCYQPLRNDVCLTLFYSEVQLTIPVTTNVEKAVVDKSAGLAVSFIYIYIHGEA